MDFKNGTPSPDLMPTDAVRAAADAVLRDPSALQYGSAVGNAEFRAELATFIGPGVDPDAIVVCNGATGGLNMVLQVLLAPGDAVMVENPTYFLALPVFAQHGVAPVPVRVDALEVELKTMVRCGKPMPRALYVVPTHSNPRGTTLSLEDRLRLVSLAKSFGFVIIADEVYHHLTFGVSEPSTPPPFACVDPDGCHVVSIGSFSKLLGPALRLGYVFTGAADSDVCNRLKSYGPLRSGGGLSTLSARIAHQMAGAGTLQRHVDAVRAALRDRADALCGALSDAGVSFTRPCGGYFVWVDVPDMAAAKRECQASVIRVLWGDECVASPGVAVQGCRLAFSFLPVDKLVDGAREFCKALDRSVSVSGAVATSDQQRGAPPPELGVLHSQPLGGFQLE